VLRLPVAHGVGAYYAPEEELDRLEEGGQIVARYCDSRGDISRETNPNGSCRSIAAVSNPSGTVVGIMPHPERATDPLIGGDDGLLLLRSVLDVTAVPA
jgi:phosphoribosylformylglycinamidine synthase